MHRSLLLAALALSSCTAAAPGPTEHLGVGTPGVSRYLAQDEDTSLAAEVARCRQPTATLAAACAQLRATMHNQPGNEAVPAAPP